MYMILDKGKPSQIVDPIHVKGYYSANRGSTSKFFWPDTQNTQQLWTAFFKFSPIIRIHELIKTMFTA